MKNKYPELYSQEFTDFCKKKIIPLCEETDIADIQKEKNELYKVLSIAISLIIIFISLIYSAYFFYILIIFGVIVATYNTIRDNLLINKDIKGRLNNKKAIIYPCLFSYYTNCYYKSSINSLYEIEGYIYNSNVLPSLEEEQTILFEDAFELNYKGLHVQMCEVLIQEKDKNSFINEEKRKKEINNIFFRITRNKDSEEETRIIQRKRNEFWIGHNNIVKLESTEFNKRFTVLSTSQTESRRILTPLFMEKLLNYSYNTGVSRINLTIDKNSINIFMTHKKGNLFEVNNLFAHKNAATINQLRQILIEHREILSLLDELGIEHLSVI